MPFDVDGIWVSEMAHDAFLPLVLAAEHSNRISLGTSIAVAFPRSPAILAHMAWDLAKYSQGRTVVGLGTQANDRLLTTIAHLGLTSSCMACAPLYASR